jgi:hypothetical protein
MTLCVANVDYVWLELSYGKHHSMILNPSQINICHLLFQKSRCADIACKKGPLVLVSWF